MNIDAAIICVIHNSRELLPRFLDNLEVVRGEIRARVILADSGSTDGSAEHYLADPRVEWVPLSANYGFAAAINAAVQHVEVTGGAPAYLIVNPDTEMRAGAASRLLAALSEPCVGIAAPKLFDEHGTVTLSLRNSPSVAAAWAEALFGGSLAARLGLPTEAIWEPDRYEEDGRVVWATGGMLAFSDACWRATGLWDTSFFMYDEEVEWALRAADAGFQVRYVAAAEAVMEHGHRDIASWREAMMRANRIALVRQRYGRKVAFGHWSAALARAGVRIILGRKASRAAFWALITHAGPMEILNRYRPDSNAAIETSSARIQSRFR